MAAGIKHIEFWVSNLQRSLDFYKKFFPLIGWQQVDDNGFSDGSTKIYFIEQPVSFNENIGPRHICFLADSKEIVGKVGEFLKQVNAQIIRGPLESSYKNRSPIPWILKIWMGIFWRLQQNLNSYDWFHYTMGKYFK